MGSIYNTIINPIAWVFGKILDFLFMGLHAIGLGNIAIAIIVFIISGKNPYASADCKTVQDDEIKQYHHAGGP